MKSLYIDLASHDACMACVSDSVVALEQVSNRLSDDELIPLLDRTLSGANWSLQDLTHIACVVGPGGFTGLRTAVTFANVLANQLGIPSTGVHLSDVYALRANKTFWVHSTKKDQLFIRGEQWKEPTLISIEELVATLPSPFLWMGELIDEHKDVLGGQQVPLLDLSDVLPDLVSTSEYSSEILHPWYGRGW